MQNHQVLFILPLTCARADRNVVSQCCPISTPLLEALVRYPIYSDTTYVCS